MKENRRYLAAVVLLAVIAVVFGVVGTFAPPLAEEAAPVQPQQGSSSESVGHFQNPPTYDSGWVNITTKSGQYFTLRHDLNTTEAVVDITGKQSLDPISGALAWNKTYGGTSYDYADSVVQTADGGYAIAGTTYSFGAGGGDFWLVKTDPAGTEQWNQTYGGTSWDYANSVVQTSDGGYALAGFTESYGAGGQDFRLVKTDGSGNEQWSRTYERAGSNDEARSVVQTSDGGYALAGTTVWDCWLVKTDSSGTAQWNKTYGGTGFDGVVSLVQTSDGGYTLAGGTNSSGAGDFDFWLIKTDLVGNALWNKTYGGTSQECANSVVQTNDGGYALAGHTFSYGAGSADFWLVKTDASGNAQWNKTYGGTGGENTYSVVQTSDGGYAIAGGTNSYGVGEGDFWLVKTGGSGNALWNQTYGGTSMDFAMCVVQTSDGGYALAGYTRFLDIDDYDFRLVRVNADMNREHQINLGNLENGLAWIGSTNTTITFYRGETDLYWNYVRVRIWTIKEPAWIYGDINMDGVVDGKDLYIVGRNYGKTFSLLSLSGIIAVAGIRTIKKRKQAKAN